MKEFQSQVFCLTGAVPGFSRGDLWEHIAARDGEFSEHMNKSVTILVVGERGQGTSKYEKALNYDTEIMEYEQFLSWLWRTPVVDKDAHLRPLNKPRRIGGAHQVAPVQGSKVQEVQGESFDEWLSRKAGVDIPEVQEGGDMSLSHQDSQPSTLNPQPSNDWHPSWAQEAHTDSTDNTDSMVQGSRFKVQESLNAKPSTLNYLSNIAAAIGTILIIIGKAVLFICGLSICVVLWLCGIPVKP